MQTKVLNNWRLFAFFICFCYINKIEIIFIIDNQIITTLFLGKLEPDEADGGGGHEDEGEEAEGIGKPGIGVFAHDLFVVADVEDDGDEDGRREAVKDRGVEEGFHRREAEKLHAEPGDEADDDHGVESSGLIEFFIEAHGELEGFREHIGEASGQDGDGQEAGADDADGEEDVAGVSGQGF